MKIIKKLLRMETDAKPELLSDTASQLLPASLPQAADTLEKVGTMISAVGAAEDEIHPGSARAALLRKQKGVLLDLRQRMYLVRDIKQSTPRCTEDLARLHRSRDALARALNDAEGIHGEAAHKAQTLRDRFGAIRAQVNGIEEGHRSERENALSEVSARLARAVEGGDAAAEEALAAEVVKLKEAAEAPAAGSAALRVRLDALSPMLRQAETDLQAAEAGAREAAARLAELDMQIAAAELDGASGLYQQALFSLIRASLRAKKHGLNMPPGLRGHALWVGDPQRVLGAGDRQGLSDGPTNIVYRLAAMLDTEMPDVSILEHDPADEPADRRPGDEGETTMASVEAGSAE